MNNNNLVQSFAFQSTNVRVIEIDNDPWFVLGDVLKAINSSTPVTAAAQAI
jgi:prophage antirepressor-like protein